MNRVGLCLFVGFALASAFAVAGPADGDPGEFELRPTPPLTAAQRDILRKRIAEDAEAAALFEELKLQAAPWLDAPPTPVAKIEYEGLVNTDARRIACVEKLRSLSGAAIVLQYGQASGDPAAEALLRRAIRAWAATYVPTGNDVNENKLYPLFVAYEALRPRMPPEERAAVDDWIGRLGSLNAEGVRRPHSLNNRLRSGCACA